MTPPPKYPRIPHLAPSPAAASDDRVLGLAERDAMLRAPVVVEEKLDGMNVVVWVEDGVARVGTRGGEATSDRSGERGRLRAWASVHAHELTMKLGEGRALYGEWLRRRHAVPYRRLPSDFIGLDVLDLAAERFLLPDARDELLAAAGLDAPPTRFEGILGTLAALDALLGVSAYADTPAEGLIVRTVNGDAPRIAKQVDPVWHEIGSAGWAGDNLHVVSER